MISNDFKWFYCIQSNCCLEISFNCSMQTRWLNRTSKWINLMGQTRILLDSRICNLNREHPKRILEGISKNPGEKAWNRNWPYRKLDVSWQKTTLRKWKPIPRRRRRPAAPCRRRQPRQRPGWRPSSWSDAGVADKIHYRTYCRNQDRASSRILCPASCRPAALWRNIRWGSNCGGLNSANLQFTIQHSNEIISATSSESIKLSSPDCHWSIQIDWKTRNVSANPIPVKYDWIPAIRFHWQISDWIHFTFNSHSI